MSSVAVNDENCGVCPGRKRSNSEKSDDIFSLDLPTGRPSILRQSQAENLPNKTVAKGIKVCFQTPRRDPVTKRLVSPTKSVKMASVDDCTKAMKSLQLLTTEEASLQKRNVPVELISDVSSYPEDNIPIQSNSGYQLDFDNLDAINPFGGSSKMVLSPPRPFESSGNPVATELIASESVSPKMLDKPAKIDMALEETLPSSQSVEDKGGYQLDFDNLNAINPFGGSSEMVLSPPRPFESSGNPVATELIASESVSPKMLDKPAKIDMALEETLPSSQSVEDKGGYQLDFDNLDAINPFGGSSKMVLSPPRPFESSGNPVATELIASESVSPKMLDKPAKIDMALEETLPSSQSVEDKGGYQLDFDNLDAINPFGGSSKMVLSPPRPFESSGNPVATELIASESVSPQLLDKPAKIDTALDETLPFTSVDNSLADASANMCSTDSSVITMAKDPAVAEDVSTADEEPPVGLDLDHLSTTDGKQSVESPVSLHQAITVPSAVEDSPLPPPKSAYQFDFDNLDSVNPFQTGGSKLQNSPVVGRKLPCDDLPPPVQEASVQPETKPIATAPASPNETSNLLPEESISQPSAAPPKDGPLKLEFNFDDGGEVKCKRPPKKFSKRPPGVKATEKKAVPVEEKEPAPPKESAVESVVSVVADDAVPKGSYSFDFEKFDDPYLNPFGTNAKCTVKSSPESMTPISVKEAASPEQVGKPVQLETVSTTLISRIDEPNPDATKEGEISLDPKFQALSSNQEEPQTVPHQPALGASHPPQICQFDQSSQHGLSEPSEEFVPGTMFMSNDFDGQMDYLEQFGSSTFQESALRKQSLYLKFDPLLRESPKKLGCAAGLNNFPRPAPFASRLETQRTGVKEEEKGQKTDSIKLLDHVPAPVVGPLVDNCQILESLVSPFPQPVNTEDAIIDVLKYNQKDMDDAIARIQAEANEKEEQWKAKCDKLSQGNQEMRSVVSKFEATITQILADKQREQELAQAELTKVLQEKEQISVDLNGMERSYSDLFKRLAKYKEVIEGFKKNEEVLKKCAQNYPARLKKEEQRYQTLKAHAEEKIALANVEIVGVRSKLKAEASGLQAQLRREQLKVQSLEKNLDQKVKEAEELTNLCDELIANVHKG